MLGEPDLCDSRGLVGMAKSIGDLDDLIRLLSKGLSRETLATALGRPAQ